MIHRPLLRLLFIALLLAAPYVHAGLDLLASEAYAAAQAGRILLVDIRTAEEWRATPLGRGG